MIVSVFHQCNIKLLVFFLFLSIVYENNKTKNKKYTLICYNFEVEGVMNMYGGLISPSFALRRLHFKIVQVV